MSVLTGYRVAFYHMNLFSLCLSNYLNIIFNEGRHANDFQDGENGKMPPHFIYYILQPRGDRVSLAIFRLN